MFAGVCPAFEADYLCLAADKVEVDLRTSFGLADITRGKLKKNQQLQREGGQ